MNEKRGIDNCFDNIDMISDTLKRIDFFLCCWL